MNEISRNLIKTAQLLSDGQYHSGAELGEILGISRNAIWKIIGKLQEYGVSIQAIKGKGYLMPEPLLLLDQRAIEKQVKRVITFPFEITVFDSITSTNDYLKSYPGSNKIKICLAETLTHSKGRLNRKWYAPFGKNIYFSCLYSFQKDLTELTGLSLACGLAVFQTIREFSVDSELALQWPNNIVWRQKKMAGILLEISAEAHGNSQAIIGIGINVNLREAPVDFAWSSMIQASGKFLDRNLICCQLIINLLNHLHRFEQFGFLDFKKEWLQHDCLINRLVKINNFHHDYQGKAIDINDKGYLVLQLADGTLVACTTGDSQIIVNIP